MTQPSLFDVHRNRVTVDVHDARTVVVDTDQGVFIVLRPDDALTLAADLTLAAADARMRMRGRS